VPDLYPKLEMGARPLAKGKEAEEILKAANLNGLSKVFYGAARRPGPGGRKRAARYVVNLQAPIVKEVADYLAREHSYGNKVTGRTLEAQFGGIGYGWEGEMLWLVLATLLRGGAVEVTYQGRRYRNHLDPQVRTPFSGTNAFRSASFAPRKAPDLTTLVTAARRYEELTGDEVDVEESAIAQAFQRLARSELEALLPLEATVRANAIPGVEATCCRSITAPWRRCSTARPTTASTCWPARAPAFSNCASRSTHRRGDGRQGPGLPAPAARGRAAALAGPTRRGCGRRSWPARSSCCAADLETGGFFTRSPSATRR
jgi:hypothetical protein